MSDLWGAARWGVDRWGAVQIPDLLQQPPVLDGRGIPTGIYDWRFVVEILLPTDTDSIWGIGVWGEATWGQYAWTDITPWVRGAAWGRGSDEPYGRPRVGTGTLTLASLEDEWSPWNPTPPLGSAAFFAPGTLIRAGCRSSEDTRAGGWLPQFTMLVDQWPVSYVGANGVDRFVDVQLVETTRDLSAIDDNALPGLVGGGEGPVDRIERLLDAAGWQYGLLVEAQSILAAPGAYPMQSTEMTQNRLAECYLTADSCDVIFRSDKTGAALLTNVEYVGAVGDADPAILQLYEFSRLDNGLGVMPYFGVDWRRNDGNTVAGPYLTLPYQVQTLTTLNDDDNLTNDVRLARVGGTQQVYEQTASISRFGRRSLVRGDLIVNNDLAVAQIAQYISIRRGLNTLRVASVDIETLDRGEEFALVAMALDTQSPVFFNPPDGLIVGDRPLVSGFLGGLEHAVVMQADRLKTWQTRFSIDTRTIYNLPGAQLPAT